MGTFAVGTEMSSLMKLECFEKILPSCSYFEDSITIYQSSQQMTTKWNPRKSTEQGKRNFRSYMTIYRKHTFVVSWLSNSTNSRIMTYAFD